MNHWSLSIFLLLVFAFSGMGQTSDELKRKQQKLREDISYKEKLLKQIEQDSKSSTTKIVLLNKKITQREELITSIKDEIHLIDEKIEENEDLVAALQTDITRLKEEYAKMVVQAYNCSYMIEARCSNFIAFGWQHVKRTQPKPRDISMGMRHSLTNIA
mgnify:CR=1 FL=1